MTSPLHRLFEHYQIWYSRISDTRRIYREQCGGMRVRLFRPKRFSEKMQWRKLFGGSAAFVRFCDKLETRKFITEHGLGGRLTPLLWQGDRPENIPFDTLPTPYILKSSHGSGFYRIVNHREEDRNDLKIEAAGWLSTNYGLAMGEPGYIKVSPRLLVEKLLQNADGTSPVEYIFFLFHGKVRYFQRYVYDKQRNRQIRFFARDSEPLDWKIFSPLIEPPPALPSHLNEMIAISEILGRKIDHVRIDFLECDGIYYLGEITPYSYSGYVYFEQADADLLLGRYWRIQWPLSRAVWSILTRRWGE